ncbi:MAG: hypothetical protein HY904_23785, partial [Deltaproteobacteria bacterium]|nr:hypothetical protein [Deltaproteobacteria bacterium]
MSLKGLTLPEAEAERIKSGVPEVPIASVPGAAGMEPGRPVRLLGPRGETLGAGVVDVENEVVRAWTLEPVQAFDAAFFKARVRRALELRRALGLVLPEES